MYSLFIKLFLRQRATVLAFTLLLTLGISSIFVGRAFLNQQQRNVEDVAETQARHIKAQTEYHPDDIGLLLYYLKFAYINPVSPLAGLAIGQTDLNNNIEHVTILALEGQKYDTDLISPSKLQVGNLDLSFVIVFLFPLVIIALTFNLWYEEVERGTWRLIKIQGKSPFNFLITKLTLRITLVLLALVLLYAIATITLNFPLGGRLIMMLVISILYILFWFALSTFVVSFARTSSVNAVVLLSLWLGLVILLPVGINSYVTSKYPVDEALTLTIKQRDEYHKKWDTDKRATVEKFNACYPQYSHYEVQDSGFSWHWYYAMQHMGDLESRQEHEAMLKKIRQRESLTNTIAHYLPPVKIQLAMNELAHTDLSSYLDFLDATSAFHERKRLAFYNAIFDNAPASEINWVQHQPETFSPNRQYSILHLVLGTSIITCILSILTYIRLRRF